MSTAIHTVYLLLGANLGDTIATLKRARIHLSMDIGPIVDASPIYDTSPWGNTNQSRFVNQAIACQTRLSPQNVLSHIQSIEAKLGKRRISHWGPRDIDIDILLYDDEVIQTPDLLVPHPHMASRRFVLIPLASIANDVIHPSFNQTIGEILELCEDNGSVIELG